MARRVFSDHGGPTNWIAIGMLSAKPQGKISAGRPAKLPAGVMAPKPDGAAGGVGPRVAEEAALGGGDKG